MAAAAGTELLITLQAWLTKDIVVGLVGLSFKRIFKMV
jgi:hypothetical protein